MALAATVPAALVWPALILLHRQVLGLPYFWDEAGYYIPAAFDTFCSGSLIPSTTLTNAHPPLPQLYLALWWRIAGFSNEVTRVAMLLVAAFAVTEVWRLARIVANHQVATASAVLFGIYPVFFAQSSLAHADLPATAFTLLGVRFYFSDKKAWATVIAFSLAALSKETAIVTPLALLGWELLVLRRRREGAIGRSLMLLLPCIPLALWFAYHYAKVGFIFGNPEFVRYNVSATLDPLRMLLAAAQRLWQVAGHMNMFLLTGAMIAAMLLSPLRYCGVERPRIAVPIQLAMLAVILGHIILHSVIGGAVLARYLMPAMPLLIIIATSTLWRRVREWRFIVAGIAIAFVAGWFVNPPYRFAPEDNLNYSDFVRLHQRGAAFIQQHHKGTKVLTAWPASDELTKPELGYVVAPLNVVRIKNFSAEEILLARQSTAYNLVFAFSSKYEPQKQLIQWDFWERSNKAFFDYHRDLEPQAIATSLGGKVVWQERQNGQWAAVIEVPRSMVARR